MKKSKHTPVTFQITILNIEYLFLLCILYVNKYITHQFVFVNSLYSKLNLKYCKLINIDTDTCHSSHTRVSYESFLLQNDL